MSDKVANRMDVVAIPNRVLKEFQRLLRLSVVPLAKCIDEVGAHFEALSKLRHTSNIWQE